jgi:hypothetical protein
MRTGYLSRSKLVLHFALSTPGGSADAQVNGYAKKIAGTVFGNKEEKEFGDKKLHGEA